jgi:hypothetical protein
MGIVEELLKNKEELLVKFLSLMEGKETKANVNLDGVKFKVGKTSVELNGNIMFTVVPSAGKGKKK